MRGATHLCLHSVDHFSFQSTRPMRGATIGRSICITFSTLNFNPRAPCGARHVQDDNQHNDHRISIHAPHAGRDFA